MSRLLELLPPYERQSKVFQEILKAQELELDRLEFDIEDLEKQLNIDTATWGLAIYERELGINIDLHKPLGERRSVIKSKWRGTGTVGSDLIKSVVDSFTNGNVDVKFDGHIIVTFNDVYGQPENMNDVYAAVEEISPAHLRVIYEYLYRTYQELIGYTHEDLSDYTHEMIRGGVM